MDNLTREEALAKLRDAEAKLAKLSKSGSRSVAKTEEDLAAREDYAVFVPGTLRKGDDSNKNVVDVVCMMPDENGTVELERNYTPRIKSGPRKGEVHAMFALDAGTRICGRPAGTKATSDLQWVACCSEHQAEKNARSRESRSAYNTEAKARLVDEIAALRALVEEKEAEVDLD